MDREIGVGCEKWRKVLRPVRRSIVVLALLAGLFYGLISWVSAERLTRSTNQPVRVDRRALSSDARSWKTMTVDGLMLRGWYLPTQDRRHLIILIHGMWASRLEVAMLGKDLHDCGFDVLLFDLRGHGQSDSSRLSLGWRERKDLRAALEWALQEGYPPECIGWVGYSMGGSTLLLEGAENPDIRVAVLDSPFGNLPVLLDSQLSRYSQLPRWFNPGILAMARLVYDVPIDKLMPIKVAGAWRDRPLMVIHGESDSTVPLHQSLDLARAVGPSCLTLTLPGIEHVRGYDEDPGGYVATLQEFFLRHLRQ